MFSLCHGSQPPLKIWCFLLDDKPLLKKKTGETRKTYPMKKGALDSDFQGMYEKTDRESDFFWSTWITRIIPENVGRRLVSKLKGDKGGVSVSGRGRKEETNTLRSLGRNPSNVYFYIELQVLQCESWQDMFPFLMVYVRTLYIYICGGGPLQRYLQARWILVGVHKEEIHKHVNNHGQDWSLKLLWYLCPMKKDGRITLAILKMILNSELWALWKLTLFTEIADCYGSVIICGVHMRFWNRGSTSLQDMVPFVGGNWRLFSVTFSMRRKTLRLLRRWTETCASVSSLPAKKLGTSLPGGAKNLSILSIDVHIYIYIRLDR